MGDVYHILSAHWRRTLEASRFLHTLSKEFYQQELTFDNEAMQYVMTERGFSEEAIKKWGLGTGSTSSRLSAWLQKHATEADLSNLIDTGVLKPIENGQLLHKFSSRITMPIYDLLGNIIGFQSRKLPSSSSNKKYLSSPSSWLFQKSLVLYGLNFALPDIPRFGCVLIVEGNFDVVSLHEAGITCAVAPSGTALMGEHLLLLKNFTNNVVTWFDSDEAGRRASTKTGALCAQFEMNHRDVLVEEFKDPDEAVKNGLNIMDRLGLRLM